MNKKSLIIISVLIVGAMILYPDLAMAGLESSLNNIKNKLSTTILPVLSVIGLVMAGMSFAIGSPNAKQHVMYAILGCIFGFGAQGIVDFVRSLVH